MDARVGSRLSPSKFLDLNISHCNSGRLRGPDLQKKKTAYNAHVILSL